MDIVERPNHIRRMPDDLGAGNRSDVGRAAVKGMRAVVPITKTVSSGTVTGAISMYGSALLIYGSDKGPPFT